VRAPDIAFITRQRVEAVGDTKGYWPGAPDLAVEVLSPDDSVAEVEQNVAEWLDAGSKQVWVVSPKMETVTVSRSTMDIEVLASNGTLKGEDVLPGFQISVAEIFAE
jgi:Uma2 family endonuclease